MIDTHSHIYLPAFDDDQRAMIDRLKSVGVTRVYLPNIDKDSIAQVRVLVNKYPDIMFPMMGLHPCSVKEDFKEQLDLIEKELDSGEYVAVGEIGLDYYWDTTYVEQQKEAYLTQISWAKERKLPFVVHSRDSLDDTIGLVESLQDGGLKGIYHCFNGTIEQAKRIINLGFYMGIGGVVTFKNAGVDKVVAELPLDFMVLETDAPYLTPVPFRGKRNEPSYLMYIAEKIADLKNVTVDEVISITSENALKIFENIGQ